MNNIFITILNNALVASWIILAVIILRFLFKKIFKKVPKWINCLLWGLAGVKLLLPFSIESIFSLIPSAKPVPENIEYAQIPQIDSGITVVNTIINPVLENNFAAEEFSSVNPMQVVIGISSYVWIAGFIGLLIYAFVSYLLLKSKVKNAQGTDKRIYKCDMLESPFILGVFNPKIYIPDTLDDDAYLCVIEHEKAHIKRGDFVWKPLGFLILSVYWFNPLCWVGYIMLCKDIEYACDEKVTKDKDKDWKARYCQALLNCSSQRKMVSACPVAFGEVSVKDRIKSVINYKKPAFWIVAVSIIVCAIVGVFFLTNPKSDKHESENEGTNFANLKTEDGRETVYFGSYEQDNDSSNGKESIEWIVLDTDGENILLISKYVLDTKLYNEEPKDITWEKSSLRSWLNNEFFEEAFSEEEKERIRKTHNINPDNPQYYTSGGADTDDYVFCLSLDEARKYFTESNCVVCKATEYAKAQGTTVSKAEIDILTETAYWWLRTPGNKQSFATVVYPDTTISDYGLSVVHDSRGVRPVIWLKSDSTMTYSEYTDDLLFNFGGKYYLSESYKEPAHGEGTPKGWYSLGGEGECIDPSYKDRETFVNGNLINYDWLDNHSENEKIKCFSVGEYKCCLYKYSFELFTGAENDLLKPGEESTSKYWVVFYTEGEDKTLYLKYFNCDYFTEEKAMESIAPGFEIIPVDFSEEENMNVSYREDPITHEYIVGGDMVFMYKKYLIGKGNNAAHSVQYIVLTNDENITWEAVNKSLYSSNSADWLPGTIIIGMNVLE